MNTQKNTTVKAIGLIGAVLIAILLFVYPNNSSLAPSPDVFPTPSADVFDAAVPPDFVWKFEDVPSLTLDGLLQTQVYLEVPSVQGSITHRLIDTTDGSCYELPDTEKDSLSQTKNIQCYAAGFGYQYKITKGSGAYLVQRKAIEEGSPEYTPPVYEYEVVAEYPFAANS